MGYSISVITKNDHQRNQVLESAQFLADKVSEMNLKKSNNKGTQRLGKGNEISYPPNSNKSLTVGFSASGMEYSSWAIMAFLAKKFDLQDEFGNHVFFYDSEKIILKDKQFYDQPKSSNEEGLLFFINEDGSPYVHQDDRSIIGGIIEFFSNEIEYKRSISTLLSEVSPEFDNIFKRAHKP